jgi:nitroreductase
VRRFKPGPVEETVLVEILADDFLAPSVGNSQPWWF